MKSKEELVASSKKFGWIAGLLLLAMIVLSAIGKKRNQPCNRGGR